MLFKIIYLCSFVPFRYIKKLNFTGTDSRLGIGFRLGEHADFQILIELGPQTETDQIGASDDAKKRRDVRIFIFFLKLYVYVTYNSYINLI